MTVTNSQPSTDTCTANVKPWETVVTCYSAVDRFFPACGLFDLTEGMYHGNPKTPYEQAEANQLDYLLDQVRCEPGRRILDLGCGYGTLLERIRLRDATGVGITISPEQVRYCRQKMLVSPSLASLIRRSVYSPGYFEDEICTRMPGSVSPTCSNRDFIRRTRASRSRCA